MSLMRMIIMIAVAVELCSCAQMAPLTGGAKDKYPPVVNQAKVHPPNYSTNFSSKGIVIEFDDYIKLDKKTNISINPGVNAQPTYRVKGKKLFVEIDGDLSDNTTYSINFGNNIQDITESNVLKNFKYVFSTGDFIDSLDFRGTVYSAQSGLPLEGAIVGLYSEISDSIPYDAPPNYIGVSNSAGWFNIGNIKTGAYKVIALTDENNNYIYDEYSEGIGFSSEPVQLEGVDSNASMIDIFAFYPIAKNLSVESKEGYKNGGANVAFNRSVEGNAFGLLDRDDVILESWNEHRDSLYLLVSREKKNIKFTLTQDDNRLDTITVTLSKKQSKFKLSSVPKQLDSREELSLSFTNAVAEFMAEDIDLIQDSVRMPITVLSKHQTPYQLIISGNYVPNENYKVTLDSASIIDVAGRAIEEISFSFSTYKENYFGHLGVNIITNNHSNMFVELLDPKGNSLRISESFYGAQAIHFDDLKPGKYAVQLIHDDNYNNVWDTGNYLEQVQPERVVRYGKLIEVRSNWNLNEDWELDKSR
jgi:hypothetical protein